MRSVASATEKVPVELELAVNGVDLSHRVKSWEVSFSHSAGAFELIVEFANHEELRESWLGLEPWDVDSEYNENGPLLGQYNPVTLKIRKKGESEWTTFFQGYCGPSDISGGAEWGRADVLEVIFAGSTHPLKDAMIEGRLALEYSEASIDADAEICLLRRIILDQNMDFDVAYRDNPQYTLIEYIVSDVSVWEALENALMETGFRLTELWNEELGKFVPTVIDPLRERGAVQIGGGSSQEGLEHAWPDGNGYILWFERHQDMWEPGYEHGNASQEKRERTLWMNLCGGEGEVTWVTDDPVDLTEVSYVGVAYWNTSLPEGMRTYLVASTEKDSSHDTYDERTTQNALDVTDLVGNHYIRIHLVSDGPSDEAQIARVWVDPAPEDYEWEWPQFPEPIPLWGCFNRRNLSGNESDVRTYVAVVYKEWPTGEEKYVYAEADQDVIDRYGVPDGKGGRVHRKMVYKTRQRSLIQTRSEAVELATVMLHDLERPTPDCEVDLTYLDPRIEPWDLIRTIGYEEMPIVDMGVMDITWSWDWNNPYGTTTFRGSAWRVIGSKQWLNHDIKREGVDIRERLDELAKTIPGKPEKVEVGRSWYMGPAGDPIPVLDLTFDRVEWWVNGRIVRLVPFDVLFSDTVSGAGLDWIEDDTKNWPDKRFSGPGRHWLFFPETNELKRVKTTDAPDRIYIESEFNVIPAINDPYIILKMKQEWDENHIDKGPYHRVSGFEEGRYIAVQESRIPSGR